ncbi:MAG: nitronate monooxygenase [archaeon]|nr:nitronate monooxygenase [archaeon]
MIETNITKMLGMKLPIISAPMGPFYTRDLALAVSEAGGLGVLSNINLAGVYPADETIKMIEYMVEHTDKPFGFNVLTSRMNPSSKKCVRQIPKFIMGNQKARDQCVYALTSAGSSRMMAESKQFLKLKNETGSKIKHFHVAPAAWLAEKCVKAGVDGVVVTGTEGGGHQSYEKVSTLVLLQQMMTQFPDLPKVACGGFATGEALVAALSMGAGAVAMGSRFIASVESEFHQTYKDIIPPAKASDTSLYTGFFGPIRLWNNKYAEHHALVADKAAKMAQEAELSMEQILEDQKHYDMTYDGNIDQGAVLLGQSIGIVNSIETVNDIIETVMKSAEAAIRKLSSNLS